MIKSFFLLLLLLPLCAAAQNLEGVPAALNTCIACHGKTGQATNPLWPNLAAQHPEYLLKRLLAYKANTTGATTAMTAIAKNLSQEECVALAQYYANQPPIVKQTPERFVARGQALYRGGDFEKHITACIACHGPQGKGSGQTGFPALSGQEAPYVISQLEAFKLKTRTDDYNGIMRDIASKMDKADMEAVAYYLQGLY